MKQHHTFPPLYSPDSKVLILGSFPSVLSRELDFYYMNPKNRFWSVLSNILNVALPKTTEDKKFLILNNNLALWDVISTCDIEGSSDSSIKNIVPNDIKEIVLHSNIDTIFVNGKKAQKSYIDYAQGKTGIAPILLPSTSPANASWSLDRLINEWSVILKYL